MQRNVRYPQLDDGQYRNYLNIRGRLHNMFYMRRRWSRQARRLLSAYLRADPQSRQLALRECSHLDLPKIFNEQVGTRMTNKAQHARVADAFSQIFG